MRTVYCDQTPVLAATQLSKMSQSFDSCLNKISGENQRVFGTENFKELQGTLVYFFVDEENHTRDTGFFGEVIGIIFQKDKDTKREEYEVIIKTSFGDLATPKYADNPWTLIRNKPKKLHGFALFENKKIKFSIST